ncbi:MAG: ParB N-terminal domain-containing protein, partial [Actinomycetota bacterium]|nr:ParB N-terminal domain-containing protein [Actinomycetota bacterium]
LNGASAFDFMSHLLIRHGIYTRGCGDKKGLTGEFVRIAARTAVENQHILRGVRDMMSMRPDLAPSGSEDDAGGDGRTAPGPAITRKLLSRDELLRGLAGRTTKQASTLLVLIENQTAHLVAQSQAILDELLTAATPRSPGRAFFAALVLGREPSDPVTVEDLERYAPEWASLVPESANIRAATAHLLGQKYSFTHPAVPRLRAALGLDTPAVQQAYQSLYTAPLATIYAREVAPPPIQSRSDAEAPERGAAETLGLRVVPVNMLFPHEYHDPQRVDQLAARITAAGVLANPPLVVAMPDGERYMVLDGATRTAAFQKLGYPHIVVQVVDPQQNNIHLNTWFHAVRGESPPALRDQAHAVAGLRLSERPIDQLAHDLWERGALGYLVTAEREGFLLEHGENPSGADWLDVLTELVDRYGRWGMVERTLVDDVNVLGSQYADLAGLVVFPQFTLDVVLQLVAKGRLLPAGITRFLVSGRILRLNVPLAMLTNDELIAQKQAWLDKLVHTKLAQRAVRQYQEPVMLFDE